MTSDSRVTRGNGRLEGFLARLRARMANRLIPDELRSGRIVDIGCGSYPYFLTTTTFAHRYGLDRLASVDVKAAGEGLGRSIFGDTASGAAGTGAGTQDAAPGEEGSAPGTAGAASATQQSAPGAEGSAPDAAPRLQGPNGITLIRHDLEERSALPFDDGSIDVVTMLAVFEHLDPDVLRHTLAEIRRILRPGGVYVLTTPAAWTDGLLRVFARLRLVSAEEIDEHRDAYTHARIAELLEHAGFDRKAMRFGTFEFGMNLWAMVRR